MSNKPLSFVAGVMGLLFLSGALYAQVPHFVLSGTNAQVRLHGQTEVMGDLTLTCDVAGTYPPSSSFTVLYAPVFGLVNSTGGAFTVANAQASNARQAHVESEPTTTGIVIGTATLNAVTPNSLTVTLSGNAAVGDVIRIAGIRANIGEAHLPPATQVFGTIVANPPNAFQIDNVSSFPVAFVLDEIQAKVTSAAPLVFCDPGRCQVGTVTITERTPSALTSLLEENDLQHKPGDAGAKPAAHGTQLKIVLASISPGVTVSLPPSVTSAALTISLNGASPSFTNTSITTPADISFTYNVLSDDPTVVESIDIPVTFCATAVPFPAVPSTTTAQVLLGPNAGSGFKSEIPSGSILSFVPNPLNVPPEMIEALSGPPCHTHLKVQNVLVTPDSGPTATRISVGFTISNQGNGTASPSTVFLRLNTSTTSVSASDFLLATLQTPVIGPGTTIDAAQTTTVPCPLNPGGYVVWVVVQGDQSRNEFDSTGFGHLTVLGSSCVNAISPASQSFTASGGTGSATVQAPNSCSWTASSNSLSLTVSPGSSGSGDGAVNFAVAPNSNANPRTGTITVAGLPLILVQAGNNPVSFSTILTVGGGLSKSSLNEGPLSVFYGQLVATTPSQPVALANFGFTQNGALISEVGVPASSLISRTRLFVDLGTGQDTGVALVNPNDAPISIHLDAKEATGLSISQGTLNLGSRGHTALFVSQMGLNLPVNFLGTLTLSSCNLFAATNLRNATNGHGELVSTALPLADLNSPPAGTNLIFPQIVDGGGLPTQILLMNPSATTSSAGTISLFGDDGSPLSLDFGDGPQGLLNYSMPPDGMVKFSTTGLGPLRVGYAVVNPSSGALPIGSGIFTSKSGAGISSQAGVPDSPQTTAARLFVEVAASPLSRNTGIAIVNRNAATATVNLSLTGLDGTPFSGTLTIPPNGHVARFITELIPTLSTNFLGVLTLSSNVPVSPLTLRLTKNQRTEDIFSTLPVADLNNPPVGSLFLPQIVDGGGFQTQLILLSTSSIAGAVQLDFFNDVGTSVALALR
ncbi:MAG: hypothetical protein LAO31_04560 [Acidobacteriia bacterium]|nr:hypothetical protein [Terriglobia bacterium]